MSNYYIVRLQILKTRFLTNLPLIIIFTIAFFTTKKTFGKEFIPNFRQINTDQGLPGENVINIIQDSQGYMWFCIEASGVCKYDGSSFTVYKALFNGKQGISSNNANDIQQDFQGNIWIATDNGLNKINQDEEIVAFYHHPEDDHSLPSSLINTVTIAKNGIIWIGTGNGLCSYDKDHKNFIRYSFKESSRSNSVVVYKILEDSDRTLWLGTSIGLINFDPSTQDLRIYNNETSYINIREIIEDNKGNLWLGSYNGLYYFDTKSRRITEWEFKNINYDGVSSIIIDSSGNVWVGTYSSGIILITPDYKSYYQILNNPNNPSSLKSSHIKDIYIDKDQGFWIGTKFAGIYYADTRKNIFKHTEPKIQIFNDFKNVYTNCFYNDGDSIYWIGTKFNGLIKVSANTQRIDTIIPTKNKINNDRFNRIQSVIKDKNNNLWIGTVNGIVRMDPSNRFHYIPNFYVNTIFQDSNEIIWVGTLNGLYVVNKNNGLEEFSTFINPDFFNNKSLDFLNIFEDSSSNLWFSTRNNGLYMFENRNGELKHFIHTAEDSTSISSNLVRFTIEDRNNNIWIGTRGNGLNKFNADKNNFTWITEKDGLPTNFLLNAQLDIKGQIWIGSHNGLICFNPETGHIESYFKNDGLQNDIYEINSSGHVKNGHLLFGGSNGLNVFHPDSIFKPDITSPIIITSVKSYDEVLARNITKSIDIKLSHKKNSITFDFVILDYNSSPEIKYQCILEGIDNDWIYLNNGKTISYKSLPGGDFTFKVKATNSYGNFTTGPDINITVSPPYYATWPFRLSIFLSSVILIILLYYFKIHSVRKRNAILSQLVNERTYSLEQANHELSVQNEMIQKQKLLIEDQKEHLEVLVEKRTKDLIAAKKKAEESDRLKSAFLANMSHEIRTPLNAIVGFSGLLADKNILPDEKKNYAKYINSNTSTLLKIIDDILDISKIESGQMIIKNEWIPISGLIHNLYLNFKNHLSKAENNFTFSLNLKQLKNKDLKIYSDPVRVEQVISNLVSNAFKYTPKGNVELGIIEKNDSIEFYVSDTGVGIPDELHETIFNRFTKVERPNKHFKGTGLGLSISKSIAELLFGQLWLESELEKGSVFHFTIPIYGPEEEQ